MIIESDDGLQHEFEIYLAIDIEQQRRGLMFVRKMPQNMGMLFVYEDTKHHSMWMKNTYLPLDMIFARRDGSVSSVIHDTRPLSLDSQGSTEPVNFVLELNAGTARRLNIGSKSRIIWERTKTMNLMQRVAPPGTRGSFDDDCVAYSLCSVAAIESARYETFCGVMPATLMRLESTI